MNTLTVNLHLLFATFFRPAGERTAILIDAPTFPSDRYAVESQLRLHGLDPARDLIVVRPRDGEALLRTEDLEGAIHEHRDRLAVALLAGVNYATGQVHDIGRLTAAVHDAGAVALWDLAHAVGNVPLALHDADVDGAAWCTYKYLNGGPGSIGQVFVHERHASDAYPAAHRLVGQRPGDPVRDGRDFRAGARRRRLADLDAADPVAGTHPRVARDLRRGRYRCPAPEVRRADRLFRGSHRRARARRRDPDAARRPSPRGPAVIACAGRAHGGWLRWRPRASSPTSASQTSSAWRRSRCTTPTTTPGARRGHSPRRASA